jgi:excisionase family DNA binding protein
LNFPNTGSKQHGEILTIDELAALLKMTRRQIYTMCETRTRNGAMKDHPLPVLKINGNLRFKRADVDAWLSKLTEQKAA